LYARVSTKRQEQEATIESQVAQLLAYAQQLGVEIRPQEQYLDQAVSGKYLARPGLDRLRDAVQAGLIERVLCLGPDRLARQLGAQQVVLDELKTAEVELIFINQPRLEDDPQAQLLLNIQGAFAEYERVLISERMRRGRLYRLRQGQAAPYPVPYGYHYQPATVHQPSYWQVVEAQALVVKQIFVCYTQQSLSVKQIAHRLNQQAVVSPQGRKWSGTTVHRILSHPAYKGSAYYARHQTDYSGVGQPRRQGSGRLRFPRYKARPVADWIELKVEPIVDEATWQAAQERLQMQAHYAKRNSRQPYLLRGLLCCDQCGQILQGRTEKNGRRYYTCLHGGKHRPEGVKPHRRWLAAEQVEPLIWQALSELLQAPERLQLAWETFKAQHQTTPVEIQHWQQRQAALLKQRQRLLDAYQAELLSLQELIDRQNPLELELQTLRQRLAQAAPAQPVEISLEAFTQAIERALVASDLSTQQELLRLLIERIIVSDEALTVEHIVPTVNNRRLYHTLSDP
jgi:site-specific DNA recombinase